MDRIFIVDVSATVRRMLKFVLTGHGYEVIEADDGMAAWQTLGGMEQYAVALLIAGLDLPSLNGVELIRKLRSHPRYCLLPIALIAEGADVRVAEGALAGASIWIAKPINLLSIVNTVQLLIGQRQPPDHQRRIFARYTHPPTRT